MNMKKIVAVASALSLTAAIAVGGTLAYLTKGTQEVKNTFTYSTTAQNINLDLNEHDLKDDKVTVDLNTPVKENDYTVLPGVNVQKDPYLTLTTENPSYIYVEIVNNAGSVVDKIYDNYPGTVEFGGDGSAWTALEGVTGPNGGKVYVWNESKTAGTTTSNIPVFGSITFKNDAPTQDVDPNATNISVFGYAIATTGMGTYDKAWETASGDFE